MLKRSATAKRPAALEADAPSWERPGTPELEELIKRAIGVLGWLPVLDMNLLRVLALCDDERASTSELVGAIERDGGLATSVLRYANSDYFCREGKRLGVREAVVMVGRVATRRMCLEAITYRFFEQAPGNAHYSRGALYMHSLSVAQVAHATALRAGANRDVAHLAGLVHDCGKLVMPCAFDAKRLDTIARQFVSGEQRSRLEREAFGVDHAHVGAVFALDSGVDAQTAAAIAWHHGGATYAQSPSLEAACVQLADVIVNMMSGLETPGPMLDAALDRLNLAHADISELAMGAIPCFNDEEAASLAFHMYRLEREANTDELTGAPNRRCAMQTLKAALSAQEHGAVLLCDVDHFKEINDTLGHGLGDAVLVEVAKLLSRFGIVGRLGGDEFVIWAPGGDGPKLAEQITQAAAEYYVAGTDQPLGISVGAATLAGTVGETLANADRALYEQKAARPPRALAPTGEPSPRRGTRDAVAKPQDAFERAARRRSRAPEIRDEQIAFTALVPWPFEVRDAELRRAT